MDMMEFKENIFIDEEEIICYLTNYYSNNNIALVSNTIEGEPYATFTVNLGKLDNNKAVIKKEYYELLLKANIIKKGFSIQYNYSNAYICEVNIDLFKKE